MHSNRKKSLVNRLHQQFPSRIHLQCIHMDRNHHCLDYRSLSNEEIECQQEQLTDLLTVN